MTEYRSIIGLYKTELVHRGRPSKTVEDVETATARWVDWFNNNRLYGHCGDVPSAELESAPYAQRRALAIGLALAIESLWTFWGDSVQALVVAMSR